MTGVTVSIVAVVVFLAIIGIGWLVIACLGEFLE